MGYVWKNIPMNKSLTILITGAGSGIGLAATRLAVKEGHRVIAGVEFESQKMHLPEGVQAFVGDLTDPSYRNGLFDAHGKIVDVLVCNAGHGEAGPLIEQPEERIRKVFEVNVMSTILLAQPFGRAMAVRGKGRLVFVTSMAGFVTVPNLGAYCGTKHALEAMADALRMELAPFNVSVVTVEPGVIGTGFNERMAGTKWSWLTPTSLFAGSFDAWRKRDAGLPARSYPVDDVARTVVRAATWASPMAHNPTPWVYRPINALIGLIPSWLVERASKNGGM